MAVARVAPADQHPVRPAGDPRHDELRIDAPRAHPPDDARVGWILQARGPGQIRRGVRAPVAEERDDRGLPSVPMLPGLLLMVRHRFFLPGHARTAASTPSISAKIWASSKRCWWIDPDGHPATHTPQPLHSASVISTFAVSPLKAMAWSGQNGV